MYLELGWRAGQAALDSGFTGGPDDTTGVGEDISGEYLIRVAGSNLLLHADGYGDKLVSTRYQDGDEFNEFELEQEADGAYRILSVGDGDYLSVAGDSGGDRLLSIRNQDDDAFSRFVIERDTGGFYRFRVQASNRYLNVQDGPGGDRLLSTRAPAGSSRFLLEPLL